MRYQKCVSSHVCCKFSFGSYLGAVSPATLSFCRGEGEHYSFLSPPCGKKPQGATERCHPGLLWPDLSGSFSYWKAEVLWLPICLSCTSGCVWEMGWAEQLLPSTAPCVVPPAEDNDFFLYIPHIKHVEWRKLRVIKAQFPIRLGSVRARNTSRRIESICQWQPPQTAAWPQSHLLHCLEWNWVFNEMKGKVSKSSGNRL